MLNTRLNFTRCQLTFFFIFIIVIVLRLQELDFQKNRPQEVGDKFVSVVSQFITVASFSFSDVEDSLAEAKELVSRSERVDFWRKPHVSWQECITVTPRPWGWKLSSGFLSAQLFLHVSLTPISHLCRKANSRGGGASRLPAAGALSLFIGSKKREHKSRIISRCGITPASCINMIFHGCFFFLKVKRQC